MHIKLIFIVLLISRHTLKLRDPSMPPTVILLLEMHMVLVHLLYPFGLILRSPLTLSRLVDLVLEEVCKLFNLILLLLNDPLILLFFLLKVVLRQLIEPVAAIHHLPLEL